VTSRVDRVNRFMLILLGLLCLAGGVVMLLLSYRVFGTSTARQTLLRPNVRFYVNRNHGWLWLAVAAGAVLFALLALRWLLAQLSLARVTALKVHADSSLGDTSVSTGGLAEAVEDEVEGYRGVDHASARFFGASSRPHLRLDVALSDTADPGAVRTRLESEALANVVQATGRDDLHSVVRLEVAAKQRRKPV